MDNLTVLQLAQELKDSGWPKIDKVVILAARYYKGLETVETLQFAKLPAQYINMIVYSR